MGDASQNKPMKEFMFALVGVVAFAVMVGFIAVSAWLRPAGAHYGPEPESTEAEMAAEVATEDAQKDEQQEDAASEPAEATEQTATDAESDSSTDKPAE